MSTTAFPEMSELRNVDLLHDENADRVTIVADLNESSDTAPTEWITVDAAATVDLGQHR